MLQFINTRPHSRAKSILPSTWATEYFLPLLQLDACPLDEQLRTQFMQCTQTPVIVVVSPTAVDIAMPYAEQLNINFAQYPIHWVAVGQKTAQYLAQYHINAECPNLETSEGMLQLPIFQQNPTQVAFWRGEGGRTWLMEQLQQQGINILNMVLYQRSVPAETTTRWQSIRQQLAPSQAIAVLISSGESWYAWHQLTQGQLERYHLTYCVLGERIFHIVQQQKSPAHHAILLENLSDEHLQQQLSRIYHTSTTT